MTLNDLKNGESGKIVKIAGQGAVRRRLLDLGLHQGETIKIIKTAPLKDPIQISVNSSHISIRRSEAALINIEPV